MITQSFKNSIVYRVSIEEKKGKIEKEIERKEGGETKVR